MKVKMDIKDGELMIDVNVRWEDWSSAVNIIETWSKHLTKRRIRRDDSKKLRKALAKD